MSCRDLDLLWREYYFRDPSQCCDSLNHKRWHNHRRQPQWVDGLSYPPWIQEKLRRRGPVILKGGEMWTVLQANHDAGTLMEVIQACGRQRDLQRGSRMHADVLKTGLLKKNIYVGTALVHMYAKCGALTKAQEVFDELPARDVVSWNALIAGYAEHGHGDEALKCFECMQNEGLSPDAITYTCALKACGSIGAMEKGEEIHGEVRTLGLMDNHDIVLGNALVSMYAKCGALAKAQEVFDKLLERDVVTWNALIAGYVEYGHCDEALKCFGRMRDQGHSPSAVTFICILKACSSIGATEKGEEIHAEVHRLGLMDSRDIVLGTALVSMYAKCGALTKAQEVFDELPARDVITWNALIAGYAEHGQGEEALKCFGRMQDEGLSPDAVTFTCILKACGSIGATEKGEEIHAEVHRLGLMENHIVLSNAVLSMYARCGALAKAQEVFDKLPAPNIVSWNAVINGYAEHGHADEALKCFGHMQDGGFSPDTVTFISILKACSSIGATKKGEEIHAEVCRLGLNRDVMLGTALVSMYAKCGALEKAQDVFNELPALNIVSWNALIIGYAELGNAEKVINSFQKMLVEHVEPDDATFVVLLTACSHAGLVEEGIMYFDTMSTMYCVIPTVEHHICMVDLLSRAGQFDQAISIIFKEPSLEMWMALLGACRKWVNVECGRWAFEHAIQLDKKCAAAYVCMSNIYAIAGLQQEAGKVEDLRKRNGA